jgi:hypothetical protein
MDIRPRKASPILKRNKKIMIYIPIFIPLLLKKLTNGPVIVPIIQANILVIELDDPNLFTIN